MIIFLKVFKESIAQAFQQLWGNKLRSFLSLLGICIGIFCIIGVQAAVDSLENNIRGSFQKLGSDMIYVDKFGWTGATRAEFMEWLKRPNPNYNDYKALKKRLRTAKDIALVVGIGQPTLAYKSNSVEEANTAAVTIEYGEMVDMTFEKGRYFSQQEYHYGANKVILGHTVAQELFGGIEPVGKMVKLLGRKLEVIGVIEKAGEDLIGVMNFDEIIFLPFELGRRMTNIKSDEAFQNSNLMIKAAEGVSLDQLKDDITGVLRAHRRLKPKQDDDFSLNELSLLSQVFDSFFDILNVIGLVIGGFAILVGIFSVANIMFVSVKERTNIIGVKKAIGAKRSVILLEFLIESIILCIIGGLFGLGLVLLVISALSSVIGFDMYLSANNVINGLLWSVSVGILAGLIPAFQASSLDPVVAIRSK
jgi:putative ABC transport system permease protein